MTLTRFALLLLLALAASKAMPTGPSSANHGGPWHTVDTIPREIQQAAPTGGTGFVSGGEPDISADGRYVAHIGPGSLSTPGCTTNDCLLYYRTDRQTHDRVALGLACSCFSNVQVFLPPLGISDDGNVVTFGGTLFTAPQGPRALYAHDFAVAETAKIYDFPATSPSIDEGRADLSTDGRYIAFESASNALVPNDTNMCTVSTSTVPCIDVFVWDAETQDIELASVSSSGAQGDGHSGFPRISDDGRYVAFSSDAATFEPGAHNLDCLASSGPVNCRDVFRHDRVIGETLLVSATPGGDPADGPSTSSDISGDGTTITFDSAATNLVPGDTNDLDDIFVRDMDGGQTERVSVSSSGEQMAGVLSGASTPTISGDGSRIAFTAEPAQLDPPAPDTCGTGVACRYVFVHERDTGDTYNASVSLAGQFANARSSEPVIAASGRTLLYISSATNLVVPDDPSVNLIAEREGFSFGDTNCDGSIGGPDVLPILLQLEDLLPQNQQCVTPDAIVEVDSQQRPFADLNCDGEVTVVDILPVLNSQANLPPESGCPPLGSSVQLLG